MEIKNRYFYIGGAVLVVVLLPFVILFFNPWSEVLCLHQDINIETGQSRSTYYVYYIKISENISETSLSDLIDGEVKYINNIEPWHRVNTFSPLVSHSPHYRYHGALSAIKTMRS